MAVVDRISDAPWLVVWKKQSDARVGRATRQEDGAIRADCRGCNGATRLLLPLGAALDRTGTLHLTIGLRVDKVSPARPVEWVALLRGPDPADLTLVKKLESMPVMGAQGRDWSWTLPTTELAEAEGELYLAVQCAPRSQAVLVSGSLRQESPAPVAPKPAPAQAEATPAEGGAMGPASRRRVRALPGGASLVFRTAGDAQACKITTEDEARGVLRLDPSACAQDLRLILPVPPPQGAPPPEGLGWPLGIRMEAAELGSKEKRSLLWLALTQGLSPVSLELHRMVAKRIRAPGSLGPLAWDVALDPRVPSEAAIYLTLQIAGGGTPVLLTIPELWAGARRGQWKPAPHGPLEGQVFAGEETPGMALLRAGRMVPLAPRAKALPEGGTRLTLGAAALDAALREAGWADGEPFEALLLAGDTLLDRQTLTIAAREEDGALEEATPARIRGWAGIKGQPELGAEVEILVNGLPYASFSTAAPGRGFETRLLLGTRPEGDPIELRGRNSGQRLGETLLLTGLPHRLSDPAAALRATIALRDHRPGVTVLVPVGDGDAAECLAALAAHTPGWVRILLLDRGGATPALLEGQQVLRVEGGLAAGFNQGIAAAGTDDVVLLAPGARPGPRWLHRLLFAALATDRPASLAALNEGCDALWARPDAARLLAQQAGGLRPEVPVMGGPCLYLRRAALDAVGGFDAESFPEGEGWQVDWAMRARYLGFTHHVEEGCLVGPAQPPALTPDAEALLGHRYAEWPRLRAARDETPAWRGITHRLAQLTQDSPPLARPRCLFVISTRTGGTPQTNQDLMRALQPGHETLLLHCDGRVMTLSRVTEAGEAVLASHTLAEPIGVLSHRSAEYDAVIADWLQGEAVELLHVRHLAWHSLGLIERARVLGIPVVVSFHDFYTLCPTVKLLDPQMTPCGGVCTAGEGDCRAELWPRETVPPLRDRWVHNWRAMMGPALAQADAFVTTSASAQETILRAYPALAEKPFEVIRHGRDFAHLDRPPPAPPERTEKLRLLVLGNISRAKGAELLRDLAALDTAERLEIHVAGEIDSRLKPARIFLHGPYERDSVLRVIEEVRPHLGAVLSLWPETYSHTLTELWSAGVPVLGFDLGAVGGAVGERIRETGGGWLLRETGPEAVHQALRRIAADTEGHAARTGAVEAWRQGEGRRYGTAAMAEAYAALYARLGV